MSLAGLTNHDMQSLDFPPDTGCEIAPACLSCPLPRCKWDAGRAVEHLSMQDINMLAAHRRGVMDDRLAAIYRTDIKTVRRSLARARLYERAVGISPRPLERTDADGTLDVRVRLHIRPPARSKRVPVIHTRDWHDRLVILRAWGFPLSMIQIAAGRLHHSTLYHHFREECLCGQPDTRQSYQRVDAAAQAAILTAG